MRSPQPLLLALIVGTALCPSTGTAQGQKRVARNVASTARNQSAMQPDSAKAAQIDAAYVARVSTIANELKPLLTKVWTTSEDMKSLYGTPSQRARRAATSGTDAEMSKQKTELIDAIKEIRIEAKRLRAISPVPRSLRRADNDLVAASFEMEQGADSMAIWADTMSHEMGLQAARQLRKGSASLYTGLKEIQRRTDPAVKAKVYVGD